MDNPTPQLERLNQAYSPEAFRKQGHQLVDMLAQALEDSQASKNATAIDFIDPEKAFEKFANANGEQLFETVYENSVRLHDPRYMGHQLMPPAPIASLAGLYSDFVNNGMGVFEMGVAGTAIERWVVKETAQRIGFGPDADGVMTCGGSLANLTAMVAARSQLQPSDWNEGSKQRLGVMISDQSHYCVDRAAKIMGWGDDGIIRIPANEQFQMKTELLEENYAASVAAGVKPIIVVGSAATTSTGSFDDLRAIGEFCQRRKIWFHIDGAHGAANAFSETHRRLVDGIELADSVTLDFHKMLMTPSVCSALIFRDGHKSYGSFSQQADYLFQKADQPEWFNLAKRTFECTKTMLGLKVYSIVKQHGWELFSDGVEQLNGLTQQFAAMLKAAPDFEIAVQPQTNIICYRFIDSPNSLNELNEAIREHLLKDGKFYIVQTKLAGKTWMRSTISNPFTTEAHFASLIQEIRRVAKNLSVQEIAL